MKKDFQIFLLNNGFEAILDEDGNVRLLKHLETGDVLINQSPYKSVFEFQNQSWQQISIGIDSITIANNGIIVGIRLSNSGNLSSSTFYIIDARSNAAIEVLYSENNTLDSLVTIKVRVKTGLNDITTYAELNHGFDSATITEFTKNGSYSVGELEYSNIEMYNKVIADFINSNYYILKRTGISSKIGMILNIIQERVTATVNFKNDSKNKIIKALEQKNKLLSMHMEKIAAEIEKNETIISQLKNSPKR